MQNKPEPLRKQRTHETFASFCINCQAEIVSDKLPVPLYCILCIETIKIVSNPYTPPSGVIDAMEHMISRLEEKRKQTDETPLIYPDSCKNCNAPRMGIQERRAYYSCKSVFDLSGTEPGWKPFNCQQKKLS